MGKVLVTPLFLTLIGCRHYCMIITLTQPMILPTVNLMVKDKMKEYKPKKRKKLFKKKEEVYKNKHGTDRNRRNIKKTLSRLD